MRSISGSAIRADFAIRGFAISSSTLPRVAFSDSLFEFFLAIIDDCTFLERRMVNSGHATIFKVLGQMQLPLAVAVLANFNRCAPAVFLGSAIRVVLQKVDRKE
jgi:hypothetical protein